jgi:hypothetical protein
MYNILANLIRLFHIIIVLFIIVAPFTRVPSILVLHITFSICLFAHWNANSNICSLSLLESQLRGIEYTNTFTHDFISPIYDIQDKTWGNVSYYTTLVLMCISILMLYRSGAVGKAYKAFNTPGTFKERLDRVLMSL